MKVLIATDKFKGSLTAAEACHAISLGLLRSISSLDITSVPIADGGEGTTVALNEALGGTWRSLSVTDPLGRSISAKYALADCNGVKTAIMEMSAASGFEKVIDSEPDPWAATTRGTGEMMLDAISAGAEKILIGIGGSATNDGGTGMAQALGFQFLDKTGAEVAQIPSDLMKVEKIVPPDIPFKVSISVACDVSNTLLGPSGATRVYGPQKGVSPDSFSAHEDRLSHLADLVRQDLGTDYRDTPGSGAAGGLGYGLLSFCNATLLPGFDLVAGTLGLESLIQSADLVITGEGKIDDQSLNGKAPAGVAQLARKLGKPVIAVCGAADLTDGSDLLDALIQIKDADTPVAECISRAAELLETRVAESADTLMELVANS